MEEKNLKEKASEEVVIDEAYLANIAITAINDFIKQHNEQHKDDVEAQLDIEDHWSRTLITWKFIKDFLFPENACGMKIINYDQFLYPKYAEQLEKKRITKFDWVKIQKEAGRLLSKYENAPLKSECAPKEVVDHWRSIVEGNVPFGYEVFEPDFGLGKS